MPEYRNWQNGLGAKCADGDEYGVAQSDCRTREINAKTKEIQGYRLTETWMRECRRLLRFCRF
ncbi:TPA: hypothetical protein ACFB6K_000831 [Neisseria gonorrhoeae]